MLGMIRHRGPDEFGIYLDQMAALGSARLSIIDLSTGQQPICNEDGSLWIVFNGEIFNYLELRPELESKGHRFTTTSDTEVLLHLFEEFGPECLKRLNGQFAFAIWDSRRESLFVARDRLGVRPLFYSLHNGDLSFASEIKALLADPRIHPEIDPKILEQIFVFWAPLTPATIFRGILEIPPGHYLLAQGTSFEIKPYWELDFSPSLAQPKGGSTNSSEEYLERLCDLLIDTVRIRLRADVPVGAYLSGGLDSSLISFIVKNFTTNRLDTFSIAFDDPAFDESAWQRQMARFIGTNHQVVLTTPGDIGRVFPEVVWHAEVPVLRTAPAPMFLLSKRVHDSGYKVVLTGEGSDEFLGGYDIFKEAKVRRFWARQADSLRRPLLLRRLYPDIARLASNHPSVLAAFFRKGLERVDSPYYSHLIRWQNGRRNCRFLRRELQGALELHPRTAELDAVLPPGFGRWDPLAQAQFLEATIFLSQYLLSSQGDRMAMAHSVEGRFPFLDFRLVEFCNGLPSGLKLRALHEKFLLKKLGQRWLPKAIWSRPKRPYRAPIHRCFFVSPPLEYVRTLLSPERIHATGLFEPAVVTQLVQKLNQGMPVSETDEMALAGILSTQLIESQFISDFKLSPPVSERDKVKIRYGRAPVRSN